MSQAINWLLASEHPAVRYKTRVNILGQDPASQEVRALQAQIPDSALIQTLLSERDAQGKIPFHSYQKWQGAHWVCEAGFIQDDRCRSALDWLETKRLPMGGFPAEKKYYRATDKAKSGRSLFDWGGTSRKRPNPFVSVDALAVLKAAGRLGVK